MKRWYERPCCYTCVHWEERARGMVDAQINRWTEKEYDLDALTSCNEGDCGDGIPGVNVEISGDASVDLTTDSNFHCPAFIAN